MKLPVGSLQVQQEKKNPQLKQEPTGNSCNKHPTRSPSKPQLDDFSSSPVVQSLFLKPCVQKQSTFIQGGSRPQNKLFLGRCLLSSSDTMSFSHRSRTQVQHLETEFCARPHGSPGFICRMDAFMTHLLTSLPKMQFCKLGLTTVPYWGAHRTSASAGLLQIREKQGRKALQQVMQSSLLAEAGSSLPGR